MESFELIPHLEALIFASEKPLNAGEPTELVNAAFGFMEDKVVPEQVDAALEAIVQKYNSDYYPFEVRQSGGGWQFLTKKDYHKTVAQLNGEKFLKRLSAAALETLAIIAYKQPITKGEIEQIRGVSADYAVQKLLEKELIVITGRNEQMPGHPLVYTTSKSFMDYFGINSPEDLPKIREVLPEGVLNPTPVSEGEIEQSETLSVSDDGQLIDVVTGEVIEEAPAAPDLDPEGRETLLTEAEREEAPEEAESGVEKSFDGGDRDSGIVQTNEESEPGEGNVVEEDSQPESAPALPELPEDADKRPEAESSQPSGAGQDSKDGDGPEEEGREESR